jgi:hypothetical protein
MKQKELNLSMYLTINNIAEIATSRASMWSTEDPYAYGPFFRFRFKNDHDKKMLYENLAKTISGFNGNVFWSMKRNPDPRSSYIIAPSPYVDTLINEKPKHRRDDFLKKMSEEEYIKMIDTIIDDILPLTSFISKTIGSVSHDQV